MAYSTLERPKLHNVRSLKFYPEQHDHHVSFRHKALPPNFDLSIKDYEPPSRRNHSIEAHASGFRKCPIYVHTFDASHQNEGDFVLKLDKHKKKHKNLPKSVIEKLEEKYWANWKPDKKKSPNEIPVLKSEKKIISDNVKIIKSAPERRRKTNKIPTNRSRDSQVSSYRLQKNTSKSQEIQTDDLVQMKEEAVQISEENAVKEQVEEADKSKQKVDDKKTEKEANGGDTKFLKHTDSLILTYRKQKEEKEEKFEQPKCIRLYKKPGKITSKNYVRGGSYPLKSCLKNKESTVKKSSKHTRPGSPIITSSNYSKNSKSHHRR